jgi:hypothetical protein
MARNTLCPGFCRPLPDTGFRDLPGRYSRAGLPLFVFLPKLIQRAMKTDVNAAINAFGKNEQTKKVFWTMFVSMTGLVLAQVLDPETARQVVGVITGMGG